MWTSFLDVRFSLSGLIKKNNNKKDLVRDQQQRISPLFYRLKVKTGLVSMIPQRTLTSGGQWTVTLEKSHASDHDVLSIFGHKHGTNNDQ